VYFGPLGEHSSNLIQYMESIPQAPKIKAGANPATYMLEVIGAGTQASRVTTDVNGYYLQSSMSAANDLELSKLSTPGTKIEFAHVYAAGPRAQAKALVIKATKNYWRSPNYNFTRMLISLLVALIFGSVYKRSPMHTQSDVISRLSVMIISVTFCSVIYINSVIETVLVERAVFYRERAANMYRSLPFATSFTLAEFPYLVFNSLMYSTVFYFTVGLYGDGYKFGWFFLYFFLILSVATFTGQLFASISPDAQTAGVLAGLFVNLWNIFSGFLISPSDIPPYWNFMFWISPFHYTIEGLTMTQFHGADEIINVITAEGSTNMTMEAYVTSFYGGVFTYANRGKNVGVLLGIIAIFTVLRALALEYLKMIKR